MFGTKSYGRLSVDDGEQGFEKPVSTVKETPSRRILLMLLFVETIALIWALSTRTKNFSWPSLVYCMYSLCFTYK